MVNEYEVQISAKGQIFTQTEFSYSIQEAVYQAICHLAATHGDLGDAKIMRCGPPARLVEAAALAVNRAVTELMSKIKSG